MLDNKVYNLMMQIIQESKSLYHIQRHYCDDSKGDKKCDEMWEELKKDKEEHINKLVGMLKAYL